MKAKELLNICCRNGVNLEGFQVEDFESPLEDCARLFGDFNACVLPTPGSYLIEWCDANKPSKIGDADALLVLDDNPVSVVLLFRID